MRFLTAIPVYNEERHIRGVLSATLPYSSEILVVDDGSTDRTSELLSEFPVHVLRHDRNEGYGAGLRDAFKYAIERGYDVLVTLDCDGQHEPSRIPELLAVLESDPSVAIVSGSRYLKRFPGDSEPPPDRRRINRIVTAELNRRLGLALTDAFCGFKAYRADALRRIEVTEPGYAMPIEVWVQVAYWGLKVQEVPVPLIYLEEERAFGGALDDAQHRLAYYMAVLERAMERYGMNVPVVQASESSGAREDC